MQGLLRAHRHPHMHTHRSRDDANSQTALRHEADGSKDIGERAWREKLNTKQVDTCTRCCWSGLSEWCVSQLNVLRQKGTDRAHTGQYDEFFEDGVYVCAGCDTPLYTSQMKWNCGCGWPGFWYADAGVRARYPCC
jgi:peptide-methionine (R)-S-oxide reductase